MSDTLEIEIVQEDPEFFQALEDPKGFYPFLVDAMRNIMAAYKTQAEIYAPESEANKPGRVTKDGKPMGYYERGRGWWYPLLTHNTMTQGEFPEMGIHSKAPKTMGTTTIAMKDIPVVKGYRLIPSSEKMHDQWSVDVIQTADEVVGVMINTASYSGYVQGVEHQTVLHKSREWRNVEGSYETTEVQQAIAEETNKALHDYYNTGT